MSCASSAAFQCGSTVKRSLRPLLQMGMTLHVKSEGKYKDVFFIC